MYQSGTDYRFQNDAASASRRRGERHAHAEQIVLGTQWGDLTGWLTDLSCGGAQVCLADGLVPIEGDDVTLRFADGRYASATLAWVGNEAIGLAFDHPLSSVDDILWIEQRDLRASYGGFRIF